MNKTLKDQQPLTITPYDTFKLEVCADNVIGAKSCLIYIYYPELGLLIFAKQCDAPHMAKLQLKALDSLKKRNTI